jgi:hypothetical protein
MLQTPEHSKAKDLHNLFRGINISRIQRKITTRHDNHNKEKINHEN